MHRINASITAYGQYSLKSLLLFRYIKRNGLRKTVDAFNPKLKKMLIFRSVGIFEYIILHMIMLFLNMYANPYGWMPSL